MRQRPRGNAKAGVFHYHHEAAARAVIARGVATVTIASDPAGTLTFILEALEPRIAFALPPTSFTLTLWAESDDTIRARLDHEPSGGVAYLQSNGLLLAFGRELGMTVVTAGPE